MSIALFGHCYAGVWFCDKTPAKHNGYTVFEVTLNHLVTGRAMIVRSLNKYPTFARTMSIVSWTLKVSRQIILNRTLIVKRKPNSNQTQYKPLPEPPIAFSLSNRETSCTGI